MGRKKRKRSAGEKISDIVLTSLTGKIVGTEGVKLGGVAGRVVSSGAPLVATGGLIRLGEDIDLELPKTSKKKSFKF